MSTAERMSWGGKVVTREYGQFGWPSDSLRGRCAAFARRVLARPAKKYRSVSESIVTRARNSGEPFYQLARLMESMTPEEAQMVAAWVQAQADDRTLCATLCPRELTIREEATNADENQTTILWLEGQASNEELAQADERNIAVQRARVVALRRRL